jgi:hypothetical protein
VAVMHGIVDAESNEGAHTDYGGDDAGGFGVTGICNACPGSPGCREAKSAKAAEWAVGIWVTGTSELISWRKNGSPEGVGILESVWLCLSKERFFIFVSSRRPVVRRIHRTRNSSPRAAENPDPKTN